jgi:hypothetical protein
MGQGKYHVVAVDFPRDPVATIDEYEGCFAVAGQRHLSYGELCRHSMNNAVSQRAAERPDENREEVSMMTPRRTGIRWTSDNTLKESPGSLPRSKQTRIVAVVLLSGGILLGACSSSPSPSASQSTTTTGASQSTTTTSSQPVPDVSQYLLTINDFPTGWSVDNSNPNQSNSCYAKNHWSKFRRCRTPRQTSPKEEVCLHSPKSWAITLPAPRRSRRLRRTSTNANRSLRRRTAKRRMGLWGQCLSPALAMRVPPTTPHWTSRVST